MAVRFFLHTRNDSGAKERTLRVRVARGSSRMMFHTSKTIRPADWSQAMQRVRSSVKGATELNGELDQLRSDIQVLALRHPDDGELRTAIQLRLGKGEKKVEPTIVELYDQFLNQKKARQKPSTVQIYRTLRDHLTEWLGSDKVKPASITTGWLEDFQTFLLGKGQQNSTVNKLTTRMKGFLKWIQARGHIDRIPTVSTLATGNNFVVYLTQPELRALINLDLSAHQPGYAAARDIFVFSAVTGQRFSDLMKLRWDDIRGDVWYLRVQKTNITIRVPLAGPAVQILGSRKGEATPLPKLSNPKANAYIKQVCKLAGIEMPVTVHAQSGGTATEKTLPKHDVVTMHDAKRTFVTLMLESGVTESQLMGLTHTDLKSLKKYAGKDEDRRNEKVRGVVKIMTG